MSTTIGGPPPFVPTPYAPNPTPKGVYTPYIPGQKTVNQDSRVPSQPFVVNREKSTWELEYESEYGAVQANIPPKSHI